MTRATFATAVLASDVPVLVDFWADWCAPCKKMIPTLEQLASDHEGELRVVQVNVAEEPDLAADYQVVGLPSFKLFVNGQVVNSLAGSVQPRALTDAVASLLHR